MLKVGGIGGQAALPLEDTDDFLDRKALGFRQEPEDEGDRGEGERGEADHDPAEADRVLPDGNTSIKAKLASQSTIAAMAAAWPRTAVGKTSPCSVQPVPPTPIAHAGGPGAPGASLAAAPSDAPATR